MTPTLPFTDVKSGDWFYEAVQYVYDKGMMTGVSADRFAPASTTTRGMIVTILYRLEERARGVRRQRLHRRGERRLVCRCRCLGGGQ
ncbi:MAG: S-layer homology domain-containing protein [Evtepia gabavorous]